MRKKEPSLTAEALRQRNHMLNNPQIFQRKEFLTTMGISVETNPKPVSKKAGYKATSLSYNNTPKRQNSQYLDEPRQGIKVANFSAIDTADDFSVLSNDEKNKLLKDFQKKRLTREDGKRKFVIVGKHSCDYCASVKKLLDKQYISYKLKKPSLKERILGRCKNKYMVDRNWASVEDSLKSNISNLKYLDIVYKKDIDKLSDEIEQMKENNISIESNKKLEKSIKEKEKLTKEYSEYKEKFLEAIVNAERMKSDKFNEIIGNFEMVYIDDDDPVEREFANKIKEDYDISSYPNFVMNKCRTVKNSKSHCAKSGAKGINGLIEFHEEQNGKNSKEIILEDQDILNKIASKYKDNNDIIEEVKKQNESRQRQLKKYMESAKLKLKKTT